MDLALDTTIKQKRFRSIVVSKLLETALLILQSGQPLSLLDLHAAVLQLPAVVARPGDLDDSAGTVGNGHALGDQLLSGVEFADDLFGCVEAGYPTHLSCEVHVKASFGV